MANITLEMDLILNKICVLAKKNNYKYGYKDAKIYIPSYHYFLEIYQQERYDERLSCFFVFNDYSIFFEHVYEAVEKRKCIFNENYSSDEEYNKKYLSFILSFYEKNEFIINEFPPKWFLGAVEISSNNYALNFSDISVKCKDEGIRLWESWKKQDEAN